MNIFCMAMAISAFDNRLCNTVETGSSNIQEKALGRIPRFYYNRDNSSPNE